MIEVNSISKTFGEAKILREVSVSLKKGEVLGLFGPNGAGKSTLMNILALVLKPDQGQYFVDSADALKNARIVRPSIGFVPQDIALFEDLTVLDNLLCWSRQSGAEAKKRAQELMSKLNLAELAKKKIKNLSGGMKRRVNLAVALLNQPSLLVMDEPLVGVDIEHTSNIVNYLRGLADAGVTQIVSGHSVGQLLPLIDTIMVIRDGSVQFLGDRTAFLAHSQSGDPEAAILQILYRS